MTKKNNYISLLTLECLVYTDFKIMQCPPKTVIVPFSQCPPKDQTQNRNQIAKKQKMMQAFKRYCI